MTEKEFSQYKGLNFKYIKLYFKQSYILNTINKLCNQNNNLSNGCISFLFCCSNDKAALKSVTSLTECSEKVTIHCNKQCSKQKLFSWACKGSSWSQSNCWCKQFVTNAKSDDRSCISESTDDDIRQPSVEKPRKSILWRSFTGQNAQVMT